MFPRETYERFDFAIDGICTAPLGLSAVYWHATDVTRRTYDTRTWGSVQDDVDEPPADEPREIVGLVCIEGTVSCCDETANFYGLRPQETDMETFVWRTCRHAAPQIPTSVSVRHAVDP